ncbi:FAD/NAD(P)-binding oxidoreductase [Enterococcus durans]|uniref:NAD(P)/FAD-dependent oxidoreductase n=1 Tax=Enterococcus durans TaxID=53345 RepID=UPI00232AC602|nr:FAD/NAD(P)-binding oxidoreductase [Enterococcus durans]MDB1652745.1 FAD/NAD(P)-binding oxidoreductase [Enterococcus durans]MDB1656526.1 FAD/NAD(P)-binding oxidoreductase [Enterococcus durans]MDB1664737.1 FAD/NAD(P)-binding oxidoreductase [Enterococcus durans]MDB1668753.1 FAD/NAD(P)-binding oxidoreductase [Enterococcus durans]MDB1671340.1 FAD/NAD(P)-binding oxidoreductase [Enterococcus durans]
MKCIIIGGSHAGVAAARALKILDPKIDVTLIEKNQTLAFISSGINLVSKGIIQKLEEAHNYSPKELTDLGVKVLLSTEVLKIEKNEIKVICTMINDGSTITQELTYDFLIAAIGSTPAIPLSLTSEKKDILTYKSFNESAFALDRIKKAKKIALIGLGFVGMEFADTWMKEKELFLIDRRDYPLAGYFDEEFIRPILSNIPNNVTFNLNTTVKKIDKDKKTGTYTLTFHSNEKISNVDLIVSTSSSLPNSQLLEGLVDLNFDHTVSVNDYLQTSIENIYAVGDLLEKPLFSTQLEIGGVFKPLVSQAQRSGFVAAYNIYSNNQLAYQSSNRTIATTFGEYYLASSGMTEIDTIIYKRKCVSVTKEISVDGGETLKLQLMFEKGTNILLGAELLTTSKILVELINLLSLMIQTKMNIFDIIQSDFYFQPEFTSYARYLQQIALESLPAIG